MILILGGLYLHHRHRSAQPAAAMIRVQYGDISSKAVAVGNILPQHTVTVKSTLASAGTVSNIMHDSGDYVTRGQALLQLKPNPDPNAYAQDLDLLKGFQADIALYQKQVQHYQSLLAKQLIPPGFESYLQAKHDLKQAQANYQLQQQKIQLLQHGSAKIGDETVHSMIYSPVDGFILERFVDVGDAVSPMSGYDAGSQLFTIANMHDLIFKGEVSEVDANHIRTGMPATITIGAFPQQTVTGTISKLALESSAQKALQSTTAAQQNTQSPFNVGFPVEINKLHIPKNIKLRSGLSATAEITTQHLKHILLAPESALLFQQDKPYVVTIDKQHKQKNIPVKLGISDGIHVQIISGISAGSMIVANPQPPTPPANN